MSVLQSRNQREGRYVGVVLGRHRRVYRATNDNRLEEPGFCNACAEWSTTDWLISARAGFHPDFGSCYDYEVESICTQCGGRRSFLDCSV